MKRRKGKRARPTCPGTSLSACTNGSDGQAMPLAPGWMQCKVCARQGAIATSGSLAARVNGAIDAAASAADARLADAANSVAGAKSAAGASSPLSGAQPPHHRR